MFLNKWSIKSKKESQEKPKIIDPYTDPTPYKYTKWQIQYFDGNDQPQVFTLNNMDTLSQQIEDYLEKYVPEYYDEHFYKEYLKGIPLAGASYVFGFLDNCTVNPQLDENKTFVEMTKKYRDKLETPEGTICFSNLTPANAFVICPMYLSISVSIADGGYSETDKMDLEEQTKKQVNNMITAMNVFTKGKINTEVDVVSYQEADKLYDGNSTWTWNFIKGKNVDVGSPYYQEFEKNVFDSYKGIFW